MTNENSRASRIIKDVMYFVGVTNVTDFAKEIGVSYMKVYYTYNGQNSTISAELISKILERYPQVSPDFLNGKDVPVNAEEIKPMNNEEMFALIERMATMLEKVQAMQEKMQQQQEKILALEERVANLVQTHEQQVKHNLCG